MSYSTNLISGAEDFSFFGKEVRILFLFVVVTRKDRDPKMAPIRQYALLRIPENGWRN
jgi:hypothetical protein